MPRIPISLRVAWTKITFSNVTLVYFVYSVGHFVVQLSIQGKVFSINDDAERFLFRIVNTAGTPNRILPYLDGKDLRLCTQIPRSTDFDIDDCPVIWNEVTGAPDRRFAAVLDSSTPSPTTLSSLLSSILPSPTPSPPLPSSAPSSPLPFSTSAVPPTTTRAATSSAPATSTATSTSTSTFTVSSTPSQLLPSPTPTVAPTPTPTVVPTPPIVNDDEDEDEEEEDEDDAESVDSPESSDSLGESISDSDSADSINDDDNTNPGPITLPAPTINLPPTINNATSKLITRPGPRAFLPSRRQASKRQVDRHRRRRPSNSSNASRDSVTEDDTLSNDSNSRSRRGGANRLSSRQLEELGVPFVKRVDPRARILRWLGDVRSANGLEDQEGVQPLPIAASPANGEDLSRRQGRSRSRASGNDSRSSLASNDSISSRTRRRGPIRLSKRQRSNSVSTNNSRNSVDSNDSFKTANSIDTSSSRGRGRVGRVGAGLIKRQRNQSISSNGSRDSVNSVDSLNSNSSRGRGRRVPARVSGGARPRAAMVSSSLPVDGTEAVNEFLQKRQDQSSNSAFRVFTVQLPNGENMDVNEVCLLSLNYPLSIIRNTRREDIVFIAFQFWVLGMSIVALLNESIPYIVASFLTHAMAMAWNAFQVAHTARFRTEFNRIITNGACAGVNLLPKYWDARRIAEIPGLVFNVIGLIVFGALSWKLFRLFGWQTFRRMGASRTMSRIYKLVLSLGVAIQLGVFFTVVQVSLWLDQLFNSVLRDSSPHLVLYKATSFITLFLLIPWLITGWVAVKRELRIPMIVFIVFAILYIVECGVMFFSVTFRFTFLTWRFFSIMASTSFVLACLIVLLGIACYLNFDHGFAAYLKGTSESEDRPISPEDAGHAAFVDYGSSLYGRSEKNSEKHFFSDADLHGPTPLPTFVLNPATPPTHHEYPFDVTPYTLNQNRDSKSTQGSNGYLGLQRTRTNSTGPDWSFVTPAVGGGAPGVTAFPPPVVTAPATSSNRSSSATSAAMGHYAASGLNRNQSTKTYTTWESFVVGSEEGPQVPEAAAAVASNRTTAELGGGLERVGTRSSAGSSMRSLRRV